MDIMDKRYTASPIDLLKMESKVLVDIILTTRGELVRAHTDINRINCGRPMENPKGEEE